MIQTAAELARRGRGELVRSVGGDLVSPGRSPEPDGEIGLRVLLANEPRSYRESIAIVFCQLRPDLRVKVVEPDELEDCLDGFEPDVAICSWSTRVMREKVPVWVELYPEHGARSVVCEGGKRTEFAEIQLSDLLSVVDRAGQLA